MIIEVKRGAKEDWFYADATELPGSPPTGCARTAEEAVARLLFRLFVDKHIDWLQHVEDTQHLEIIIKK